MKLTRVHVREFKSIRDSNPFDVGNVTCLVGKNEAGKTAILEALYRLNPVIPQHAKFDVTEDYPRAEVEEYQVAVQQKKRTPATPITAVFTLDRAEMEPAEEEFGKGVFRTPTVTLSRAYGNDTLYVVVDVDENVAVKHLLASAGLPAEVVEAAGKQTSLKGLHTFLEQRAKDQQTAHAAALAEANAIEDAQEKAKAIDESNKLAETQAAKQLRAKLTTVLKSTLIVHIWREYLKKSFPEFLYFDEYYQMEGQVNIQRLKQREANKNLLDSDRPMLGLIELARLDLDQLLAPQNTQALVNKLEGASNYLSKQIFKVLVAKPAYLR